MSQFHDRYSGKKKHYPHKENLDSYDAIQTPHIAKNVISHNGIASQVHGINQYSEISVRPHQKHAAKHSVDTLNAAVELAAVKVSRVEDATDHSTDKNVPLARSKSDEASTYDIMKTGNVPPYTYKMLQESLLTV